MDIDVIKILLDSWANPNIQNENWYTPLMISCDYTPIIKINKKDKKNIVKLLLENWANTNIQDNSWETAFNKATKNWYDNIIELLHNK